MIKKIYNYILQIYHYIINLVFGNCIYCNDYIHKINTLCDKCESKLVPFIDIKCIFCYNLCVCINVSYSILYKYNRIISDIILKFKYNNEYDLSIFFANRIVINCDKETILVSIPTSRSKLYKRGYNQSVELCKELSKKYNIKYDPFVLKKIKTTNQQNKNYIERIQNASSMEINNIDNIRNKNIIIVDDIIASGATILRCIYLLKPYVKNIHIIAIAKTS